MGNIKVYRQTYRWTDLNQYDSDHLILWYQNKYRLLIVHWGLVYINMLHKVFKKVLLKSTQIFSNLWRMYLILKSNSL